MITTLMLGTTKGAFLATSGDGADWRITGPHCDGWTINHVNGDPASGHIWAGGGDDSTGAGVWRSADGGQGWHLARLSSGMMDDWAENDPDFAAMIGWDDTPLPYADDFSQVWSLLHTPDALYAGTKPAILLKSTDDGQTWQKVDGLSNHPSADSWTPGGAGLGRPEEGCEAASGRLNRVPQ